MLLYHGSNTEIAHIELEKCRPFKDFGKGFYLTTIKEQAVLMAKRTAKAFLGNPYITTFEFNEKTLKCGGLSIKSFDDPTVEWAIFVLNNRSRSRIEIGDKNCNRDNKYDIVTGPVANDDIAFLFRTFTSGLIDADALLNGMKYKKMNNQYSFHTEKAILYLTKVGAERYE